MSSSRNIAGRLQKKKYDRVRDVQAVRWENIKVEDHHNYALVGPFTENIVDESQCHPKIPDSEEVADTVHTCNETTCSRRFQKDWSGRRVVDLGLLADGLSACKKCGMPLQLTHCQGVINFGLSPMFKIPCSNTKCNQLNNIPIGKRHGKVWDANSKLAAAVQQTGIGYNQVSGILAELNIPPISKTLLSARQEEVGACMEAVAEPSIQEALAEEVSATNVEHQTPSITVSVDGARQKRGSGRSYDSLTGLCSMIGNQTGKVFGYSVRNKTCRICENAENNSQQPAPHDCKRNWKGSSKSMKPDMVVDMVLF